MGRRCLAQKGNYVCTDGYWTSQSGVKTKYPCGENTPEKGITKSGDKAQASPCTTTTDTGMPAAYGPMTCIKALPATGSAALPRTSRRLSRMRRRGCRCRWWWTCTAVGGAARKKRKCQASKSSPTVCPRRTASLSSGRRRTTSSGAAAAPTATRCRKRPGTNKWHRRMI